MTEPLLSTVQDAVATVSLDGAPYILTTLDDIRARRSDLLRHPHGQEARG